MSENHYKYLGPWRGSRYRQYFYKERKIFAQTLYSETVGPDARSPEQVAQDYDVPAEAVYEAIDYCTKNADLLRQERDEDLAEAQARERSQPSRALDQDPS